MKRSAALRNTAEIGRRLHSFNGIIGTSGADRDALKISRAWVFGSTAKGSDSPNDVDILIDAKTCGRFYSAHKNQAITDKEYKRRYGSKIAISSREVALKRLRKGLKMVRFHDISVDGNFEDIAQTKIMIYPRNDFEQASSC